MGFFFRGEGAGGTCRRLFGAEILALYRGIFAGMNGKKQFHLGLMDVETVAKTGFQGKQQTASIILQRNTPAPFDQQKRGVDGPAIGGGTGEGA